MRFLGWLILIGFGIFMWSQSDPESFQGTKEKLKDKAAQSLSNKTMVNLTNQSLITEQNFTNILNGTYSSDTINYGRPKKVVEFLCQADDDCDKYIPNAPQNIRCNKSTGECII
ncbi:MAG: hypothetical protein AABY15_04465 [Nanoarchaeota archaeon]